MSRRTLITIGWPKKGVIKGTSFEGQPSDSMRSALNVRGFDPRTGQFRGSQRSGLESFASLGSPLVQEAFTIIKGGPGVGSASVNTRTVYAILCKGGVIGRLTTAGSFSAFTGDDLSSTPKVVFGVPFFGKGYFCDGTSYVVANPETLTSAFWTPTSGDLPEKAKLIETHRGRIFLAGMRDDPENYIATAVGSALNLDTAPRPSVVTQAFAGNVSNEARVADTINSMIPWTRDAFVFGCDHSIWMMTGDPAAGGRVQMISGNLGVAFGRPWCLDDASTLYFVGSRGGLYRWAYGGFPELLSTGRVDEWLTDINFSTQIVRLAWSDVEQGVHVWLTDLAGSEPAEHVFWSRREDAFYVDQYGDVGQDPICPFVFDGSAPDDRKLLVCSRGGTIYEFNKDNFRDGHDMEVVAWLGPFSLGAGRSAIIDEIQVTLGENTSSNLRVDVFDGESAEAAFSAVRPRMSFVAKPGRNPSKRFCGRGSSFFLKLSRENSSDDEGAFSFEKILLWLEPVGRAGQRRF